MAYKFSSNSDFDKFYTNQNLLEILCSKLFSHFRSFENIEIIEPSAGDGRFYKSLIKYSKNIS